MPERRLIVLLGAARSGTKLVRDYLGTQPDVCTVPYDINFVWRQGNERHPDDELPPHLASQRQATRIRQQLERWWTSDVLVEKTVSNSLRVPFVSAVFPNAYFIHLVRDGYDVVESSYRQWLARPDWRYLLRKLRSFPPTVAPRYVARAGRSAIARQLPGRRAGTPVWGPVYRGMDADVESRGILATCALQWVYCVERATSDLAQLVPDERVLNLRYEEVVTQPEQSLARLTKFSGVDLAVGPPSGPNIRTSEQGKGRRSLSPTDLAAVEEIIEPVQRALGYS